MKTMEAARINVKTRKSSKEISRKLGEDAAEGNDTNGNAFKIMKAFEKYTKDCRKEIINRSFLL